MKEKEIRVRGHQRAGNHILAALIELNLYDSMDSERHHDQRGHLLPNQCQEDLDNLDIINVFIHRDFDSTLDSIYRMRKRFSLKGTKEDFYEKHIIDLFDPKAYDASEIEINWHFKPKQSVAGFSAYFGMFQQLTLNQWHNLFIMAWLQQAQRPNVYVCKYETLITEVGRTMILRDIGKLVDRTCKLPVQYIGERVGYYQKDDDTWNK